MANQGKRKTSKSRKSKSLTKWEYEEKYGKYGNKKEASNDPKWYTRNEQLARDAASIAFTWPSGSPVSRMNAGSLDFLAANPSYNVPGIMAFQTCITPGYSDHFNSALNIASRKLYSWVRHANSGHANYEAPNLMMYILAMDSAYSFYAHMARVYGILRLYSQRDRYLPNGLMEAVNCDANDFLANIADFRYFINNTALKLNAFCVPNRFDLFKRHAVLFTGVYKDSMADSRSQYYMFVPWNYYVWDETVTPGKLISKLTATNTEKYTFASMKAAMTEIIDAIASSEDFNIMSGDIRKAFGDENLVRVNGITEDYSVIPVYDEWITSSIQNMVTYPVPNTDIIEDVTNQCLIYTPAAIELSAASKANSTAHMASLNPVLTSPVSSPTPEDVFEMSRLIVTSSIEAGTGNQNSKSILKIFGTEIIRGWYLYTKVGESVSNLFWYQDISTTLPTDATALRAQWMMSKFNRHPKIYITDAAKHNLGDFGEIWDVDNFAVVAPHTIEKLHETALLSLLDVPTMTTPAG